LWFFFTLGIFFSFAGLWGGHFLRTVLGLNQTQAGNVLNMLAIAMIVGSPLLSWLSDRIRSRKKVLVGCSVLTLLLSSQIAFLPDTMSHGYMYVWCFLIAISASAVVVIGFTSAKELFPVSMAGTSTGLVNLFPFLGGAVVQWLLGLVIESLGGVYNQATFTRAFLLYFVCAVVAMLASLVLKETFPRPEAG
jgi:sugar phosphate permease